ncbi:MAG: hypothetical protein HOK41_05320 [Nitrospina sp.]|jgi:hypothetical protein|nr:hypothetical protein [Nitrospina sp.]MBT6717480.1 hypothetical protein [Nitrospina sp.]
MEKVVRNLLEVIPNEHLVGIDSITLFDKPQQKKYSDAQGMYWKKYELQPARIEIFLGNIYGEYYFKKFLMPSRWKWKLAGVLYHEIGHHYRHFTHGINKKQNEDFAEKYKKEIRRKKYPYLVYLVKPLRPVIRWLLRVWPE